MSSATDARDVAILTALADPIRLDMVKRLSRVREITGVELAGQLGISRALLCHHAGILVNAGVATRRKAGQTGYLSLNDARLRGCVATLWKQIRAPERPMGSTRRRAKAPKPTPR